MSKRRVVITGMGAISPAGLNVASNWANIVAGKSGISSITRFDASSISCQVAGEIDPSFDPTLFVEPRNIKKMDTFIKYGMAASTEAVEDSRWKPETDNDFECTGVILGSGIGGL